MATELGEKLQETQIELEKMKKEIQAKSEKLQADFSGLKDRVGTTEKELAALEARLNTEDIWSVRKQTDALTKKVTDLEAALAKAVADAAAFKAKVSGFFKEVFYNNPWGNR